MANDSSTGGFLTPASPPAGLPAPPDDAALDDLLQATVAGILGISGLLVRPRFQPKPPIQPPPEVNWCAIGVTDSDPDDGPFFKKNANAEGVTLIRHELLYVLVSMYGPNAKGNCGLLRDGISLPQNMVQLKAMNLGLQSVSKERGASELVNTQWIRRFDMQVLFTRENLRTYGIRTLVGANVHLFNDSNAVNRTIQTTCPPKTGV